MNRRAPCDLVLVDGATQVRGIRGWLGLILRWPQLRRALTTADGYVAHRIYLAGPTTVGLLSWWENQAAVYRFAHGDGHHDVWRWSADQSTTRGGWLAMYQAKSGGALWGSGTALAATFGRHFDGAVEAEAPSRCPAHHS